MDLEKLAIDYYNGAHVLRVLAAWAHAMTNPQVVAAQALEFERAYAELVRLHGEGKIHGSAAHFSTDILESIRRINELIQPGVDTPQACQHAGEIHALAEQCIKKLSPDTAPVVEPDIAPVVENEPE